MTTTSPVVLGGNGVIGRETVRALLERGHTPRSVGRRPAANPDAISVLADLLDPAAVARALEGAEVAYFVAGLPYSAAVWERDWPVLMRNTIDAALATGARLVYFDNVYAYGRATSAMTEDTAVAPSSRKGRVRARALEQLAEASDRGLDATIVRSADVYGPGATTSVFTSFALDRIAAGRTPTWLIDADQPHSLTYTPDIGDALALLGTSGTAPGGIWHVPTAPALTGREYVRLAAGADARLSIMGRGTLRIGALFNRSARETLEMTYQYEGPYVFDSRRFETAFGVAPTPVADGIAATLAAARAKNQHPETARSAR